MKTYLPECPFYRFTHLYCPGCGSQRSLHAILHGDIQSAVGYNPLMVLALVFFLLEAAIWVISRRSPGVRSISSRRFTPVIVFVLVMSFWIMRNIPLTPFNALAP
jgi:hypothetical protein